MSESTGETLTEEQLQAAAEYRWGADTGVRSWSMVCQHIRCAPNTLRAARQTERWEAVAAEFAVKVNDLRRDAFTQLGKAVMAGEQWAVKEALDRTEGAVEQTLNVNHGGDAATKLANLLATRTNRGGEGGGAE